MSFFESILTALALSTDAFACAIIYGKSNSFNRIKYALLIGCSFGLFQFFMPIIGFGAGSSIRSLIDTYDHWLAFFLLIFVSFKMLKDAINPEENRQNRLDLFTLVSLSIATSLDALAVGMSIGLLQAQILVLATIIGVVCFSTSFIGFLIGQQLSKIKKLESYLNIIAAFVLLGIGFAILYKHGVF